MSQVALEEAQGSWVRSDLKKVRKRCGKEAGPVRIRNLSALVTQDEMEDMLIEEGFLKCLGIDPHEKLAARLEGGKLEAKIDATKMPDKSAQRKKFSMIAISGKGSDAGEEMKSADASQSPDLEGDDDCSEEDGDETLLDKPIAGILQKANYISV